MNNVYKQETHRVKLLVGALEISLEQATILALLRITSSAMPRPGTRAKATPAALSPTATVLLEPAAVSSGRQHPSAMPQPSLTPTLAVPAEEVGEEEVKAAHPDVATTEGESDSALLEAEAKSSAGAMMIPMMPSGVTVTLSVDVAAVGVVLTESGARVAAVTISAATCKVNVSTHEHFSRRTSSICGGDVECPLDPLRCNSACIDFCRAVAYAPKLRQPL